MEACDVSFGDVIDVLMSPRGGFVMRIARR
jgi:hypothetical protein